MAILAAQPQTIGKVLDGGFRLFKASFPKIILLALIYSLLVGLPGVLFPGLQSEDPQLALQALPGYIAVFYGLVVVGIIFLNAVLYRMRCTVDQVDDSIGAAMGIGLRKLIPVVLAMILYTIAVAIGTLLLVIPGIILMLSLLLYSPLIVLDNQGIWGSLKQSHHLVWGNWWRTAAVFLIPAVIFMVIYIIVAFVAGIGDTIISGDTTTVLANVVNIVAVALATPLFYAVMLAQLHDLKLRKQGLDLESRMAG